MKRRENRERQTLSLSFLLFLTEPSTPINDANQTGTLYFTKGGPLMARSTKLESGFQDELKKDLQNLFPGCIVTKLDPTYIQGLPDLLVLYKDKWATLECKKSANAKKQPNQPYYVDKMNDMSFSRFIYPENKEEVLYELQQTFGV